MNQKLSYAVIGGDTRQVYLLHKLIESGYSCITYGLSKEEMLVPLSRDPFENKCYKKASSLAEAITHADYVLGPIPFCQDDYIKGNEQMKVSDLLHHMHKNQHLFAGCIDKSLQKKFEKKGIYCHDYMEVEEIALFNSIATAEGMLAEAIINYPCNLHRSRCLIIGYGRCGKTLADKLKGIGADVTICTRKTQALSAAYCMGYPGIHANDLKDLIKGYDLIFNTVPTVILDDEVLKNVLPISYIFDLASKPGGVDWVAAKSRKLHAGSYLGLPGKYAPASSAVALYDFIMSSQTNPD